MAAGLTVIGIFIIGFSFFNEFVGTVYYYLFADVVPRQFIGRFTALFSLVTQISGFITGITIGPFLISHMKAVHIGIALIYFVGFTLMCWKVKEGRYPPVEDVRSETTFMEKAKLYFRECFSHRIYVYMYASVAITALAAGLRLQEIFPLHLNQHQAQAAVHRGGAQAVALTPDGMVAVTAGGDGVIQRWEMPSTRKGAMRGAASAATAPRTCVALARDGRRSADAGADGGIIVRDAVTLAVAASLPGHPGGVRALAFSPDGTLLASAGEDRMVRIWRAADGQPVHALAGHGGAVGAIAFSSDGLRLVSGGADGGIMLWDVTGGTLIRQVASQPGPVNAVTFMPALSLVPSHEAAEASAIVAAGRWLKWYCVYAFTNESLYDIPADARSHVVQGDRWIAAGGRDGERDDLPSLVRIWDVDDGALIGELKGHKQAVTCIAYKPDLRMLLSGSHDETVRLWDPVELIKPERGGSPEQAGIWARVGLALGLTSKTDQTLRSYSGYTHQVTGIACADSGSLLVNTSDRLVGESSGLPARECTGMLHVWDLDQGISLKKRGIAGSFWGLIGILIAYPVGVLVDRFNPLRITIALSLVTLPFQIISVFYIRDYVSSTVINAVRMPFGALLGVAFMPLLIMIFPRTKFGQFSSARALLAQGVAAIAVPMGAICMDFLTVFTYDTDAFRYVYLFHAVITLLSLIPLWLAYRQWKRLGGDGYVAPDLEPRAPA
jgi:WD40 repeat protein